MAIVTAAMIIPRAAIIAPAAIIILAEIRLRGVDRRGRVRGERVGIARQGGLGRFGDGDAADARGCDAADQGGDE
jgi:hypothetical protein